jgi:hypothetical protein
VKSWRAVLKTISRLTWLKRVKTALATMKTAKVLVAIAVMVTVHLEGEGANDRSEVAAVAAIVPVV